MATIGIALGGMVFFAPAGVASVKPKAGDNNTATLRIIREDGTIAAESTSRTTKGQVVCTLYAMNPHYSDEYKGVIAKQDVVCKGDHAVTVRVTGSLGSIPGDPPPSEAPRGPVMEKLGSDQTQTVLPGQPKRYYTPELGSGRPGGPSGAWYENYLVGEIIGDGTLIEGRSKRSWA